MLLHPARKKVLKFHRHFRDQTLIEKLVLFAAIATPLMTLPQVYQIWVMHNKGASVITWASYVLIAFIWLAYGIKKREVPIVLTQTLCIITYSSVVVGLLI